MTPTYITTHSRRQFSLTQPDAHDVRLLDIAHALAHLCRFTGHVPRPYSVAEHSVHVAELVRERSEDPYQELCALLHDATEAYLGDVSAPAKALLPDYRALEDRVWHVIARRYSLERINWDLVKAADVQLLVDEGTAFFGPEVVERWGLATSTPRLTWTPQYWTPEEAMRHFVNAFQSLVGER